MNNILNFPRRMDKQSYSQNKKKESENNLQEKWKLCLYSPPPTQPNPSHQSHLCKPLLIFAFLFNPFDIIYRFIFIETLYLIDVSMIQCLKKC